MTASGGISGLLGAVLTLALHDVKKGGRLARDAEEWIDSDRDDHALAFRRVCESLDLPIEEVRRVACTRRKRWIEPRLDR